MKQTGFLLGGRRFYRSVVIFENQSFSGTGVAKGIELSALPVDDCHRTDPAVSVKQTEAGDAVRNKKGKCGRAFFRPLPADFELFRKEPGGRQRKCGQQQECRKQIFHMCSPESVRYIYHTG